jgi:hypothetical protein
VEGQAAGKQPSAETIMIHAESLVSQNKELEV